MKKQFFLIGTAAMLSLAACNDNATTDTTMKDSTVTTNPGDTTVQTTTTTTTTTKTVHPIANFEKRIFYNVVTKKPVKLRMDTVLHFYVDVTTNQQPDYYYYDPAAKDTFDYYGRRLNNALMNENGTWRLDESRITDDGMNMNTDNSSNTISNDTSVNNSKMNSTNSKMKIKVKDDKTKMKTKDHK
jgi:hypothetical protein